jgi:hypothetical protein
VTVKALDKLGVVAQDTATIIVMLRLHRELCSCNSIRLCEGTVSATVSYQTQILPQSKHVSPALKCQPCNVYRIELFKVTLRPTVSRPVLLGVRRPFGTRDQFFFLVEILFRQLRVCYFVAPSLTRGRICNLLSLLVLASAVPLTSALSDERSGLSFASISL